MQRLRGRVIQDVALREMCATPIDADVRGAHRVAESFDRSPGVAEIRAFLRHLGIMVLAAMVPFACHSAQPDGAHPAQSAVSEPSLGTAASFLVLGGSTVTNTGATTVHGDLGVDPGLAITGFPPGLVLGGAVHAGDAVALLAQNDVTAAYTVLAGDACAFDLTGQDLGGLTLKQGVYCFSSEAQLTGALVLDAEGDPSAVFVFQIGSKLTTASNASVAFINGGQDCRTFWQVGSSATLGTDTVFVGNILALTSIALQTRASVSGRALARNGAVTMDTNQVSAGSCASGGSDAGVDTGVEDSGGGAGDDGSVEDSGASDAGVDACVEDSGGSGAGDDGSVEDSGASDAGNVLCCNGVLCGTSCIDLSADVANCGSCGHACLASELCSGGSCVPCAMVCEGACVDLAYDSSNCGACGHVCSAGEPCRYGSCVPCATLCEGQCVELPDDHRNCGSCGHACLDSEVCSGGSCVPCAMLCEGACIDLANDRSNCGSCGNSCAPGESCNSGSCVCQ